MIKINLFRRAEKKLNISDHCGFAQAIAEKYRMRRSNYLGFASLVYNDGSDARREMQQINNFISNISMQVKMLQNKNSQVSVINHNTILSLKNVLANYYNYTNFYYRKLFAAFNPRYGDINTFLDFGIHSTGHAASGISNRGPGLVRITNLLPLLREGLWYGYDREVIDEIRLQLKEYLSQRREEGRHHISAGPELGRRENLIQKKYVEEYVNTVLKDKIGDKADIGIYSRIYETLSLLNQEVSSQRAMYQSTMTDIYRSANHDYIDVMDRMLLADRASTFLGTESLTLGMPYQAKRNRRDRLKDLSKHSMAALKLVDNRERDPGIRHIPWEELSLFELKNTILQEKLLKKLWFNKNTRNITKAVNEYFSLNNYSSMALLSSVPLNGREAGANSRETMLRSIINKVLEFRVTSDRKKEELSLYIKDNAKGFKQGAKYISRSTAIGEPSSAAAADSRGSQEAVSKIKHYYPVLKQIKTYMGEMNQKNISSRFSKTIYRILAGMLVPGNELQGGRSPQGSLRHERPPVIRSTMIERTGVKEQGLQKNYMPGEMNALPMEYRKSKKAYTGEAEKNVPAVKTAQSEFNINKEIIAANDMVNAAIDFEKITDRVYEQIEKRLRFERQRAGL